eukprot:5239956-Prymnesium_polylepis.1
MSKFSRIIPGGEMLPCRANEYCVVQAQQEVAEGDARPCMRNGNHSSTVFLTSSVQSFSGVIRAWTPNSMELFLSRRGAALWTRGVWFSPKKDAARDLPLRGCSRDLRLRFAGPLLESAPNSFRTPLRMSANSSSVMVPMLPGEWRHNCRGCHNRR